MGRLIVRGQPAGALTRSASDLRGRLAAARPMEVALCLGALLGEASAATREEVVILVPWTEGVAETLTAVARRAAGPWQVDLLDEPRPTQAKAAEAWRSLRLLLSRTETEAQTLMDPQDRLLAQSQHLKQTREQQQAQAAAGGRPPLDSTILESLALFERPEDVRQRLGLGRSAFERWAHTHREQIKLALTAAPSASREPRVEQQWAALLADPAPEPTTATDKSEDADFTPRAPRTLAQASAQSRRESSRSASRQNIRTPEAAPSAAINDTIDEEE